MSSATKNIQNDYEHIFRALQDEIKEHQKIIKALELFRQKVTQGLKDGIFDDQDMQWIDDDLQHLLQEKEHKEKVFQQKREIYENSVLKLESILEKRRNVIEEVDSHTNIFSARPELLKKFAQKRATLMKIVDQGKKDLQQ